MGDSFLGKNLLHYSIVSFVINGQPAHGQTYVSCKGCRVLGQNVGSRFVQRIIGIGFQEEEVEPQNH